MVRKSDETLLGKIMFPALEAIAKAVGVGELPKTIRNARPEVLNLCTTEVQSFIIYYAHHYENNEDHDKTPLTKIMEDWREMTGSHLSKNTLYKARSEVYYPCILGNKKFITRNILGCNRTSLKIFSEFALQQQERKKRKLAAVN